VFGEKVRMNFSGKNLSLTFENENSDNGIIEENLRVAEKLVGCFSKYANPELAKTEKEAWANAAVDKWKKHNDNI
jgi:hypothetical protein